MLPGSGLLPGVLPLQVFESAGQGCLPAETNVGVVHACHATDSDLQ